jgi:hypothetical protein
LLNTGSSDASVILSLWSDAKGNIYAATGDVIKKIAKNKLVTTIYKSDGLWKPSGGLIAANGDFWVLEYNIPYKVRTIKVRREMQKQIAKGNSFTVIVMPLLLIVFTLAGVWFLFRKKISLLNQTAGCRCEPLCCPLLLQTRNRCSYPLKEL